MVGCCESLPTGFTIVFFHMKTKGRFEPRPWPASEDDQLRLLVQKHNMRETARLMGKSYDVVVRRVRVLGLKVARSHQVTFSDRSRAVKCLETHGVAVAASRFGVSRHTIYKYARQYRTTLKEFSRELTPEDVRAVRAAAHSLAVRSGKPEDADDFASYCSMIRLTRKETKIQLKNLWIDYLREHYGNKNSEDGLARWNANQTSHPITESSDGLEGVQVASPSCKASRVLAIAEILGLEPLDKVLWLLIHQEGYELAQIAPWFGVTESGLSRRLTGLLNKARSRPYEKSLKDVLD